MWSDFFLNQPWEEIQERSHFLVNFVVRDLHNKELWICTWESTQEKDYLLMNFVLGSQNKEFWRGTHESTKERNKWDDKRGNNNCEHSSMKCQEPFAASVSSRFFLLDKQHKAEWKQKNKTKNKTVGTKWNWFWFCSFSCRRAKSFPLPQSRVYTGIPRRDKKTLRGRGRSSEVFGEGMMTNWQLLNMVCIPAVQEGQRAGLDTLKVFTGFSNVQTEMCAWLHYFTCSESEFGASFSIHHCSSAFSL